MIARAAVLIGVVAYWGWQKKVPRVQLRCLPRPHPAELLLQLKCHGGIAKYFFVALHMTHSRIQSGIHNKTRRNFTMTKEKTQEYGTVRQNYFLIIGAGNPGYLYPG